MPFGFGRTFGFTSPMSISLLTCLPPLLSTLFYCTPLINLSLKTNDQQTIATLGFCLLALLSSCRLPFSSLLLLSILLNLLQSHSAFFLCSLVLLLFHILLLHVSGLLLSFYIVRIFFLSLLSSVPLLWSRFHNWILPIFFCSSTSSPLLSTLVIFLWRYFRSVYYIWIPLSFSPSLLLLSFFYLL